MTNSLDQRVYDHLLRKLSRGEIGPGSRLSEVALATEVGVSRTPVREAFARLRSDGVIDVVSRYGWFVHVPSRGELEQLYAAREMLECFAAELAARRRETQHLEEMSSMVRQMEGLLRSSSGSPENCLDAQWLADTGELDRVFHEVIFRAAGNGWVERMAMQMSAFARIFDFKQAWSNAQVGSPSMHRTSDLDGSAEKLHEIWATTVRDHREIYDAIVQGDSPRASHVVSQHVRAGLKTSLSMLEQWQSLGHGQRNATREHIEVKSKEQNPRPHKANRRKAPKQLRGIRQ